MVCWFVPRWAYNSDEEGDTSSNARNMVKCFKTVKKQCLSQFQSINECILDLNTPSKHPCLECFAKHSKWSFLIDMYVFHEHPAVFFIKDMNPDSARLPVLASWCYLVYVLYVAQVTWLQLETDQLRRHYLHCTLDGVLCYR